MLSVEYRIVFFCSRYMHHDRSIFPEILRIRSSLNLKNFYSFLLCIEAMVIDYCFASVLQQLLYAVAYVASKLLHRDEIHFSRVQ
jgi:hypothetical protein